MKKKFDFASLIPWIFISLIIMLALAGIGFVIYVYATYSNTPIQDLPAWVLPFFTGGRK